MTMQSGLTMGCFAADAGSGRSLHQCTGVYGSPKAAHLGSSRYGASLCRQRIQKGVYLIHDAEAQAFLRLCCRVPHLHQSHQAFLQFHAAEWQTITSRHMQNCDKI